MSELGGSRTRVLTGRLLVERGRPGFYIDVPAQGGQIVPQHGVIGIDPRFRAIEVLRRGLDHEADAVDDVLTRGVGIEPDVVNHQVNSTIHPAKRKYFASPRGCQQREGEHYRASWLECCTASRVRASNKFKVELTVDHVRSDLYSALPRTFRRFSSIAARAQSSYEPEPAIESLTMYLYHISYT